MRPVAYIASLSLVLSGCATTSFAPPQVNVHDQMVAASLRPDCVLTDFKGAAIRPDVAGALTLIANYLDSYRCTMRIAANGRQAFELPTFLSLVGSTTAVALGGGPNWAILGGTGNSVFTAGKSYYAPQKQTEILSGAVDALACIQTEAVGISPFTLVATATAERNQLDALKRGGKIEISVERQYFNMVSSALIAVERAAAQQLATRGSFDAAGVAAEIENNVKKIREAQEAKDDPPAPNPAVVSMVGTDTAKALQAAQLDLNEMQPKLQQCVTRAKA